MRPVFLVLNPGHLFSAHVKSWLPLYPDLSQKLLKEHHEMCPSVAVDQPHLWALVRWDSHIFMIELEN